MEGKHDGRVMDVEYPPSARSHLNYELRMLLGIDFWRRRQ